jgi:hypothetical protein
MDEVVLLLEPALRFEQFRECSEIIADREKKLLVRVILPKRKLFAIAQQAKRLLVWMMTEQKAFLEICSFQACSTLDRLTNTVTGGVADLVTFHCTASRGSDQPFAQEKALKIKINVASARV